VQTGSVTLSDATSPQVLNYQGLPNNYQVFHFHVPAGADRPRGLVGLAGRPVQLQRERVRDRAQLPGAG